MGHSHREVGPRWGITGTPVWVAGFLRWPQDHSAVCHGWTVVFSLSPWPWDQNLVFPVLF